MPGTEPTERPAQGERTVVGMPVRVLVVGTLIAAIVAVAAGALVALTLDDEDDEPEGVIELQDEEAVDPAGAGVVGAPLALAYESFDGESLNTAGYLGQPLVLNFFAEWCAPCVREMPAFEEVHQEVGDSVAFLGLSIDRVASDGQALVDSTGITYDVGRDATGDALGDLGGTGMPTTVFVDEAGTVVEVHSGELTADDLRARLDEHFG
ncbi:TlpA family protein disulfide reductase [Actinomarinicola tropica]|uniref:Redoxin domain-containing protein n=1 Tax=Actinomarinicola tropica TaxID=2789776 RepID=A0A5Q2RGI9_9ACTN|nr:TlpA disulfide reductase family protein [Actinomarinicola tropica]QGG93721.1 redoxin domain-containing protein [Actinomarinicola tropica]